MEEKSRIESAFQNLRQYFEIKWNLLVVDTSDKASDFVSSVASILLIALSMLFVLLFLSIGAALWIGHSYGDTSMGFLFVGLFYLLVSIVIFIFRHTLVKMPVMNKMIYALHANEND